MGADAGVRVWVISAGTKGEVTRTAGHRVKITLVPVDSAGNDLLIDSVGQHQGQSDGSTAGLPGPLGQALGAHPWRAAGSSAPGFRSVAACSSSDRAIWWHRAGC